MGLRAKVAHWLEDYEEMSVRRTFISEPEELLTFKGELGVGEARIGMIEEPEVQVDLRYNRDQPLVKWEDHLLRVSQHSNSHSFRGLKQKWKVQLPTLNPLHMEFNIGKGKADFDLQGAKLECIDVNGGVGDCRLNLSDTSFEQVVPIHIDGGVGNHHIILPAEIPATIEVDKGVGKFSGEGLILRDTGVYCTRAYQEDRVHLDLRLQVGVGNVTISEE